MEHNVRRTGDLSRLRGTLAGFFQQADLLLLGLCCLATLYGMALIASATRYMDIFHLLVPNLWKFIYI